MFSTLEKTSLFLVVANFHSVNIPNMADFKLPVWSWEELCYTSIYYFSLTDTTGVNNLNSIGNSKMWNNN